jgi:dipeptidase D
VIIMQQLEPSLVWRHFATLCSIPRPSKQEAALRRTLADWAAGRGLETLVDGAGNLLIKKPGSPGKENHPALAMQAHLDMVCQANAGTKHDFTKDPIAATIKDGWLIAENTTLGADNGIGVALALAALEDETLSHPPLEVLLTIDEEAGMSGANGLESGILQATRMLNLDTEEWGEFYLGCAGGCDVNVSRECGQRAAPAGWAFRRITVSGLRGGHSGIDIHRGRGNANKLLVRLLLGLARDGLIHLKSFSGGTARNALPREAWAEVAIDPSKEALFAEKLQAFQELVSDELSAQEKGIEVKASPAEAGAVIADADQTLVLFALNAAPHGVKRMSDAAPGIVETSNNVGVMSLADGIFLANLMVRSLRDSGTDLLADEIESLFRLAHCKVERSGGYPGWTPNPSSKLLALAQQVYRKGFGGEAAIQIIHAGLECGIIGAKYPGMDIISFGPTIKGAHAPGERVEIETVAHCWTLVKAIIEAL